MNHFNSFSIVLFLVVQWPVMLLVSVILLSGKKCEFVLCPCALAVVGSAEEAVLLM